MNNTKTNLQALCSLPSERQDQIAPIIQMLAGHEATVRELTDEEKADIDEAIAEVERGELAKYGL